ncbi:class II aldolase/adducin family protein [Candidatus Bathyarchaeota archaeon]|nr:class II aldolase/adducin family protein [Candidatus Bathyarchaeota archaeon]
MRIKMIKDISQRLVKAGRELHKNGLFRGTSGKISARIPGTGTFLIKPSGAHMKFLKTEELVLVDLKGNKIKGELNCSLENPYACGGLQSA